MQGFIGIMIIASVLVLGFIPLLVMYLFKDIRKIPLWRKILYTSILNIGLLLVGIGLIIHDTDDTKKVDVKTEQTSQTINKYTLNTNEEVRDKDLNNEIKVIGYRVENNIGVVDAIKDKKKIEVYIDGDISSFIKLGHTYKVAEEKGSNELGVSDLTFGYKAK